jgi:hypothetical protein
MAQTGWLLQSLCGLYGLYYTIFDFTGGGMHYTGTENPLTPSLSPSDGARENHLRVW